MTATETGTSPDAAGPSPEWLRVDRRRPVARPTWWLAYPFVLVVLDAVAMAVASETAIVSRFGNDDLATRYTLLTAFAPPGWVLIMGLSRAYERRFIGVGSDEFRRVVDGALRGTAVVATLAFGFKLSVSRGFVGVALPVATVLTLTLRVLARKVLHRQRKRSGRWSHRVLAVGSVGSVASLVEQTRVAAYAGLEVVGALVVGASAVSAGAGVVGGSGPAGGAGGVPLRRRADDVVDLTEVGGVPVVGGLGDLVQAVESGLVDTVAVTDANVLGPQALRRIAWALEGRGVDLVVSPSLTDVAGPRIHVRPVAGLTLLHVEEPQLSGARVLLKGFLDRLLAGVGVVLISPVLVVIAVLIRRGSPGPALFRQVRVGRDGREFRVVKFRSMYVDAEARKAGLSSLNESDGLLFKMKEDPRVTKVGAKLRRYSLDELPQIFNVLRGEMSLIGPRPPLPAEVREYGSDVRRRLLVKPGMTGLWQTSGRSDLSWEESVRLDLFYVENWSIALDAQILWKTVAAVLFARGAY